MVLVRCPPSFAAAHPFHLVLILASAVYCSFIRPRYPTTTAWWFLSARDSTVGAQACFKPTTPTVTRSTKSPTAEISASLEGVPGARKIMHIFETLMARRSTTYATPLMRIMFGRSEEH